MHSPSPLCMVVPSNKLSWHPPFSWHPLVFISFPLAWWCPPTNYPDIHGFFSMQLDLAHGSDPPLIYCTMQNNLNIPMCKKTHRKYVHKKQFLLPTPFQCHSKIAHLFLPYSFWLVGIRCFWSLPHCILHKFVAHCALQVIDNSLPLLNAVQTLVFQGVSLVFQT